MAVSLHLLLSVHLRRLNTWPLPCSHKMFMFKNELQTNKVLAQNSRQALALIINVKMSAFLHILDQ